MEIWNKHSSKKNKHSCISMNKLMELDANVLPEDRMEAKNPIEKMKKEYKNHKKSSR